MKKLIPFILCITLITSCKNNSTQVNADFDGFKNRFVENLWKMYPGWATSQGYHNYDSVLNIPNDANRQAELKFAEATDDSLKKFDLASLNSNNRTDYKLIGNFTEGIRFSLNELKEYQWNPAEYNIGETIFNTLDYAKMPLEDRLRNISKKLAAIPAYFRAAKKSIDRPTNEHTLLAIEQNKGSLYLFTSVFPDSVKKSKLTDAEIITFSNNVDAAKKAVEDYVQWLQDSVLPNTHTAHSRSFRIGKELYAKKFKLDNDSRYTADEMYQKALDRKTYLHNDMNKLTTQLWPKYFGNAKAPDDTLVRIKMMIDTISTQHCKRDEFLQTIEKQLPELTAFINAHNIIGLDSTKPLKVRKTPDYEAGVAGAGINSPGPYDKDAVTYYNVTPLTNYTDSDAESYLREYNNYVLQILNIHEAIPGHYTQLIYANRSPSIIKAIFGNGTMVEGWACYVETIMLEQGYNLSPEMQLFYDKWNLREACNFILDRNIHCNNWSKEQVMELLVKEAFQQNKEAEGKWKRATLSQVQLTNYFTGLTEIYELREEIKQKQGDKFDLKKFHEQFLSFGSAPVKEIRELMLESNGQ